MLSTDRKDFESQLQVLFGGFPTFLTEPRIQAYWRGLQKMPLSVFVRCVDHALGERGSDKLPTVNTIWQLSRTLRAAPPPQSHAPPSPYDDFHLVGQRWLFAFLLRRAIEEPPPPDVTEPTLQKLIEVKNRIIAQYRASGEPCGGKDIGEWLDVAQAAFVKIAEAA